MRLELEIPRELRSPNAWLWKHWRVKQKERIDWHLELAVAVLKTEHRKNLASVLTALGAKFHCDQKRRVMVTRVVPSARRFIRDDDNLRFSVKPVNDALKKLGLIKDDNRKWLEQPMPTQEVSSDGKCYTRIVIEDCE